jgi:RNA polymerase sigma factor (sigma-70 family)
MISHTCDTRSTHRGGLMASSERVLIDRVAAGEQEAFGLLFAPYRAMLLQFAAARVGGDAHLAEDIVQEAALNAYRALAAGARPENLRAWLFTIARNCASNARRAGRTSVPIEEYHEADASQDPAQVLASRERLALLAGALGELPDRQRRALLGHALEGRSYREIAIRQDSTVAAVKTLIHRARRSLGAAPRPALLPFPAGARRLAGLLARGPFAGKDGARGALGAAAQALSAAVVTTGILMAVPGAGAGPVLAGGLPHHGRHAAPAHRTAHRHSGGHRPPTPAPPPPPPPPRPPAPPPPPTPASSQRIHSEARHAIARCLHGKSGHYTPAALLYARRHLPADVIEYTECPEQLTHQLLRAIGEHPRGHRSRQSPHAGARQDSR